MPSYLYISTPCLFFYSGLCHAAFIASKTTRPIALYSATIQARETTPVPAALLPAACNGRCISCISAGLDVWYSNPDVCPTPSICTTQVLPLIWGECFAYGPCAGWITDQNSWIAYSTWFNSVCGGTNSDLGTLAPFSTGLPPSFYNPWPLCGDVCRSSVLSDGNHVSCSQRWAQIDCSCQYLTACTQNCWAATDVLSLSQWSELVCQVWTPFVDTTIVPHSPQRRTSLNSYYTRFTDNVGFYLDAIQTGAPSCLTTQIPTACPQLSTAASTCYQVAQYYDYSLFIEDCFCPFVAKANCPGLCQNQTKDASDYYSWVEKVCGFENTTRWSPESNETSFSRLWVDYSQYYSAYNITVLEPYLNLFPWNWHVQYHPEDDHRSLLTASNSTTTPNSNLTAPRTLPTCPSIANKIGSFASVNAVVFIATLFLGRRTVVYKITCHLLGSPVGTAYWPFTALLFTALSILGNYINARLIHATPGFSSVPIGNLVLLWCTRPRVGWMGALLIRVQKEQSMYFSTAASALLGEAVLQCLASVYMGLTVRHASRNGYYHIGAVDGKFLHGRYAMLMFAGAALWIAAIGLGLIRIFAVFSGLGRILKERTYRVWVFILRHGGGFSRALVSMGLVSAYTLFDPFREEPLEVDDATNHLPAYELGDTGVEELFREAPELPVRTRLESGPSSFYLLPNEHLGRASRYPIERASRRPIQRLPKNRPQLWAENLERMGLDPVKALAAMTTIVTFMVIPYIGQWLFWIGFLNLAQDFYCPPNLGYLTTVWSVSSILGLFLGAAI